MNYIPVSIHLGLYSLVVIPPLAIISVDFALLFIILVFRVIYSVVCSYHRFSIFQHLLHVLLACLWNAV